MAVNLSEFQKQGYDSWVIAAEKALKGKPLNGLNWKVDDIINLQPIYTADQSQPYHAISIDQQHNRWHIGENFDGSIAATANDLLLKALQGGLDSPLLFDVSDFQACLDQVRLDFLFPIFRGADLDDFLSYAQSTYEDIGSLKGGFIVYEAGFNRIDLSNSIKQLSKIASTIPQYYHSMINIAIDASDIGQSMGRSMNQLSDMIFQMLNHGITPRIICEIECDSDFLKNAATIRAFRHQVNQMCEVYDISSDSVLIDAYAYESAQDTQLAMIGASAKAISAVSAGVYRLTIESESMNVQLDEVTTRRMARNIHHLMMMESGLDQTIDPLAGSYTIEILTDKIAERSWSTFQLLNK